MTRHPAPRPPRIASCLIGMFAPQQQAEAIDGDLLEEFSEIKISRGAPAARRWYWKQSLKTSVHLFCVGLRSAPGLIACTTIGAFFFLWATQWLPVHLVFGILERYSNFFDAHFRFWWFCVHYGGAIVGWTVAVLLGCLIGLLAKGKEVVATATFGVFRIVGAPFLTILLFRASIALLPHHVLEFMGSNVGYIGVILMRGINFAQAYRQGYGRIGLLLSYCIQPFTSVFLPILGGLIVRKVRQSSARTPLVA